MVHLDRTGMHHRAGYVLEMGLWRATCLTCGYSVTALQRRQAAMEFHNHARDAEAPVTQMKVDPR